jgi:hypothetical protein
MNIGKKLNKKLLTTKKNKMENQTKKAKVKETGQLIEVYKLKNGNWCNYADCKT